MSLINSNSWLEFEIELARAFDGVRTPGSGSAKKEEDVKCQNMIIQAKYTGSVNTQIKDSDMSRLIDACELMGDLPVFATKTKNNTILSIPIDKLDDCTIELFISMINTLATIHKLVTNCTSLRMYDVDKKIDTLQSTLYNAIGFIKKINGVK